MYKEMSTMDWSMLRPKKKKFFFFFFRGEGALWFESTEQFCQIFLCLPSSLSLNFSKGEKSLVKQKVCVGGWGTTSSHMRTFQLMLTTYLYVAHSTILFRTPQKPSLFSPWRLFLKTTKQNKKKNLKYLDITNQQAPSVLSQRMQWSLPPLTTLLTNNTNNSIKN